MRETGPSSSSTSPSRTTAATTRGSCPPADAVHLESDEVESPEVDEFLAAIKRSDEDPRWLIEELNARDEPTIVVFFGDHQPGFADWLFEETFGKPVEDANLEEVQARYRTPYFIWANAAARGKYGDKLTRTFESTDELIATVMGNIAWVRENL